MIDFASRDEGIEGIAAELEAETLVDMIPLVKLGAVMFEGAVKLKLTGQRSGRFYKVSKTGELHQASAPGEAPAVQFGHLRNSIGHTEPKVSRKTSVRAFVGTGLGAGRGAIRQARASGEADPRSYARILEFGGITGRGGATRILPRPYFRPAQAEIEPKIEQAWSAGL